MIGSCGNDDWAVKRAADCTLLVLVIDAEFDEAVSRAADYTLMTMKMVMRVAESKGRKQSRRLHPLPSELCRSSMTGSTQMMLRAR